MTERTGIAVRHCTNMLEAKGLYHDLAGDMRRITERSMVPILSELKIEGEEHIKRLAESVRVGVFLFYKECLMNICRHSGARRMSARLVVKTDRLALSVSDDGKGMDLEKIEHPPSLCRRARLLGATLKVESKPGKGARILLALTTSRFRFLCKHPT